MCVSRTICYKCIACVCTQYIFVHSHTDAQHVRTYLPVFERDDTFFLASSAFVVVFVVIPLVRISCNEQYSEHWVWWNILYWPKYHSFHAQKWNWSDEKEGFSNAIYRMIVTRICHLITSHVCAYKCIYIHSLCSSILMLHYALLCPACVVLYACERVCEKAGKSESSQ